MLKKHQLAEEFLELRIRDYRNTARVCYEWFYKIRIRDAVTEMNGFTECVGE
jgi:hypothetical protein